MSFRGRGRGRGRGRFASFEFRRAKHEPFILFPEDINLPPVPNLNDLSKEEKMLISTKIRLENFWKSSPYYLGDGKQQDEEDEQFADKLQRKRQKPHDFGPYMKLNTTYFPAELIQGEKKVQVDSKRLRPDTKSDDMSWLKKLEEEENRDNEKDNGVKEKKDEDEDEDKDEDADLEEEETESSDDYNQNEAFDDDDDDFNPADSPDEDYYE